MRDRLAPLEGVVNFRDFGGYGARDGRTVVRGALYRAAHFAQATDRDRAMLDALGVRFVVDLRRPEERELEPNAWPGEKARTISSDLGQETLPPHMAILSETDLTAATVERYMMDAYRSYIGDVRHSALFSSYLTALSEEGGPSVVHCAAGKDRTGVACALVLSVLGVDRETIFRDYEFTNEAVDLEARLPLAQERLEARLGRKLDPAALRPMVGVSKIYLEQAFAAIDEKYGALESYLEQALAFGADRQEAMRARFLI